MEITQTRAKKYSVYMTAMFVVGCYVLWFRQSNIDINPVGGHTFGTLNEYEKKTPLESSQNAGMEWPGDKRLVNALLLEYNSNINNTFQDLVAHNVSSRDPDLISLIQKMMDPPSKGKVKTTRVIVETLQSRCILDILKQKKNGFFVEAGGFEGEYSSNTLYLEQKMGWKGLLVEMDPNFYTQLIGKSRRCWSINACIGPSDHPVKMKFLEASGAQGKLTSSKTRGQAVPCFPLESMLLALNTTHIDYFSLDVEGYELEVLRTIPFDRISISTLSVEYVHGNYKKEQYKLFMEGKGFHTFKDITHADPKTGPYVDDYIFVGVDSYELTK